MPHFPEEILEQIFSYITHCRDRNALSLVSKTWYDLDRRTRHSVFIGNCYALAPERSIKRFPNVRSLSLKGKPKFVDCVNWVPRDWGGSVDQWVVGLARDCPDLRELRLKRMLVSDPTLLLISGSFPNFRSLALIGCHGFSADGLSAITAKCRFLEHLDLQESEVGNDSGQWLSSFPESFTSLISLNFGSLRGAVNLDDLMSLVARCPNLKNLRVNKAVPLLTLPQILLRAPQLVELGIEPRAQHVDPGSHTRLYEAIRKCKSIRSLSLSGALHISLSCQFHISAIFPKLISLDIISVMEGRILGFINLLTHCHKLQRLRIMDSIGDEGLRIVASTCKDLQDLRIVRTYSLHPVNRYVTEEGVVAISKGCPLLVSLQIFCHRITNAALITVSKNCPCITCFRLCLSEPKDPDHVTLQPLDEGFGAIVQSCEGLKRLSLSGLLTDQVFLYIGMYAENLEMLSTASAGDSDRAMLYVLNGCRNLRKLEIRDCCFGDNALLANVERYEMLRFLWMQSCDVTLGGCKFLATKMPLLNVEIINGRDQDRAGDYPDDSLKVGMLYIYRTLDGPRTDAPNFVWTL
ncbi:Protein AUXIN SIGNALING F-BOX like [Actinidia chinensis var. chinensis]|uniref:Protein AUXIN SIGNALING F-BOX like n=1 Tax=Actinidia chinensis var. chinensis TaxID=1590841 RepID=A0A2R6QRG6_ACTCC|nr:Protein AUXIN SIGNALING F-BOX like [Actinidia chinensis var. chinensis]